MTQSGRGEDEASVESKMEQLANQLAAMQEQLGAIAARLPEAHGAHE